MCVGQVGRQAVGTASMAGKGRRQLPSKAGRAGRQVTLHPNRTCSTQAVQ